ncbi:hypothetical protein ONZ45_g18126 [Pleurotus djamor]|nr:hypothetical protein ONZ45_g18126 [Pleurotus djamor]
MSTFTVVEPKGWEYDLQSVYSAYIGFFQAYALPWYDRTWAHIFSTFEEFLAFSWPVITVTDTYSGRAHVVTRMSSINAFIKMVKTRFGETLAVPPNILRVTPYETSSRPLRNISDFASWKKLHQTLAATHFSALKSRVRTCEAGIGIKTINELWAKREKTFLALDFEWSERNDKTLLEWGYAAVRCGYLESQGHWPPIPDKNYMKGHYIVGEYVDKQVNKHSPSNPWLYAFGESQVVPKATLPTIIQAIISSFASPDSETTPNNLVLVGHGIYGDMARLEAIGIKIPHNIFAIDIAALERTLHATGLRPPMNDPNTGRPRSQGTSLPLELLLHSLALPSPSTPPANATSRNSPSGNSPTPPHSNGLVGPAGVMGAMRPIIPPGCILYNAGNDAFMCLFALQMLLEPEGSIPPSIKPGRIGRPGHHMHPTNMMAMTLPLSPSPFVPQIALQSPSIPMQMSMTMPHTQFPRGSGYMSHTPSQSSPLLNEFGQLRIGSSGNEFDVSARERSRSPGPQSSRLRTVSTPMSGDAQNNKPANTMGMGPKFLGNNLKTDTMPRRNSFVGL